MPRITSLFILLLATLPMVAGAQRRNKKKAAPKAQASPVSSAAPGTDYRQYGAPMPTVRLVGLDGTVWTGDSFRNGRNSFLMLFNPGCDHCQMMTQAFQKDVEISRRNKVALIAGEMMKRETAAFAKDLKMDRYPALKLGLDSSGMINNIFLYQGIPQINVYNPDGVLIRAFSAITSTDSLKQYIEP